MSSTDTVKLIPHGQKLAVVLDRNLLRQLGIDENTPVSVTRNGESIQITRANPNDRNEKFQAAKTDTFDKYDSTLKKLAE